MKQSLGLLEVSGLALAISCADVMAKAASITLVGLEKTNGSGWMMLKIIGDVASVQAAISTRTSGWPGRSQSHFQTWGRHPFPQCHDRA